MGQLHLICVGKLQDRNLQNLEETYTKRLSIYTLTMHEIRSSPSKVQEGEGVLKKIAQINPKAPVYLLAEQGRNFDNSNHLSLFFQELHGQAVSPIFVLGGACGHSDEVRARALTEISLSPLTFPHQWARILFIEQLYRSQSIIQHHPYHK